MSYDGYKHPTPPVGGDVNHGIALRTVTIMTFTLALAMSVLRSSARIFIVKKTGWDDWVMGLATVCIFLGCDTKLYMFDSLQAYWKLLGCCCGPDGLFSPMRCKWRRKTSVLSQPGAAIGLDKMEYP